MNTIFLFSGESLVYGFDDLTGSLQLSHKLVLSSKDYPGILLKYCQHFKWGRSVLLQCSVCDQETILTKLLPLLANEYTSIPAECQGKLAKYMGKKPGVDLHFV